MARRSAESLPWSLFGAGGFMVAFFFPIHILLFGILIPLGLIAAPTHTGMLALVNHPLTRHYLFGFCALGLLHAAHRLRFTLSDMLRLKHLDTLLGVLAYGAALVGVAVTIDLLI